MDKASQCQIIISAGGTGGHIMPALAIGEELASRQPPLDFLFLCGAKPLERQLYEVAGHMPCALNITPMRKGVFNRIRGGWQLAKAVVEAYRLLGRKDTTIVLGMGGYVTAPVLVAGLLRRIPIVIHEQNTLPGRTNYVLARWAKAVLVGFRQTKERFRSKRCYYVGNPVRRAILSSQSEEARTFFNLPRNVPVILVLGGSQGAKMLNLAVLETLKNLDHLWTGAFPVEVLWSTGTQYHQVIEPKLREAHLENVRCQLLPYIEEMHLAYAAASLVICRAGASTIAELTAKELPAILIPFPYAIHNHQLVNAQVLERDGAAIVIREQVLTAEHLAATILRLLNEPEQLRHMAEQSRRVAAPDAARNIVDIMLRILKEGGHSVA
jgi:UDP-N-acetylglucosamine--N-acetylmuramyl-(pentapeptide) pyrophosphoryl-undecaprenol N-acetylglucosamine transferase